MKQQSVEHHELSKSLSNRHLQLIAIGGVLERVCLWGQGKPSVWRGLPSYLFI
jgi:D-serine/D-alanine/glycine transporter